MTAGVSNERLDELKRHAQNAYATWAEARQKAQMCGDPQPSQRHGDWWLGYHQAIKDLQSGAQPWPVDFGLYPAPTPGTSGVTARYGGPMATSSAMSRVPAASIGQ